MHGAVSLELAHLAADPEHHAIRGRGRVVDPVLVRDQRRRPAEQVHEVVPVGVVAGQPRHLEAHQDPHLGPRHRSDEPREARPRLRRGAASPLVLVEDHDLPFAPPQCPSLIGGAVLPPPALHVLPHLPGRGLADVDKRRPLEMLGRTFDRSKWSPLMTRSPLSGRAAPAPPARSTVRTARSRLVALASGVVATAPRGGLPGGRETLAWAWGPSFETLTCPNAASRVNDPPPVQGLHDLKQGPDRIHAEHRIGLARPRGRTVGIRPRSGQPHRESVGRTHDQLARASVQNLESESLQWVVSPCDRHPRRRRRGAVIAPIV
jgi:hypothetical protein